MTLPPPAGSTQTLTTQHMADSQPAIDDLPDELLADILRHLPPRSLALCRSVCKHWCAAVDARGLLLAVAHLIPSSLHGIFISYAMERRSGFFSRVVPGTSSQSSVDGLLSFLPGQLMSYRNRSVMDHRNGLVLYANRQGMFVCNPVTQRWATLPVPPGAQTSYSHLPFYRHRMYLMFDPTMSLHYDVLFFPDVPEKPKPSPLQPGQSKISRADYEHELDSLGSMEWPPHMYPLQVFSSKTGRWEEKQFIREGDAAVTISDVWLDGMSPADKLYSIRRHAVYWRAMFYVHCDSGFIMRLSLEKQNYLVIETPKLDAIGDAGDSTRRKRNFKTYGYLEKSKHGVYYTALRGFQLQVWVLRDTLESCQTPEWELKHQANLTSNFNLHYNQHLSGERYEKCWIFNGWCVDSELRGGHGWDSSDDSVIDLEGGTKMDCKDYNFALDFLGYHPYREIAFLGNRFQGGFAYYLENSKLLYLGSPYPSNLEDHGWRWRLRPILESFIYTPCLDDLFPIQNDA